MSTLGKLHALRRHPVKSLRGESLEAAFVGYSGVQGDRVYALVQPGKGGGFPWLTAREQAELLLYEPRFVAPPGTTDYWPARAQLDVRVRTPEGDDLAIDALAAHLAARFGRGVELRFSEAGMPDAAPLSLLGLASVAALGEQAGVALEHRRFRANLVAAWDDPAPRFEETLVGRRVRIGETLTLAITARDSRCVMTNLDPDDAHVDKAVFATIAKTGAPEERGRFGVYAAVLAPGVARVGDALTLVDG